MVGHTPGPWFVDKEGRICHRPEPLVKYVIAEIQSSNDANEALICAAPDLLYAAENILARLRGPNWNKPDTEMYIKALEAAVERAKGN